MVMEYVQGKNLEQYLHANGIFSEFENTSNFTPALDIYAFLFWSKYYPEFGKL
ncbi:hypothetical protein FJR41_004755 [Dolichospermum planctonicum UHCC 0167]|jgi:hypothetical protein|uniref:hypothetical protein n=1 Tax=Dolichospermum planctonicum TaxID=136072 RepID=UPI0020C46E38|nr:hypothetical protein [Dolichospermum planctonicum]MCW9680126.1 hypothetical protein [Dolichospermum planctonicum UHCC 0167]